MEYPEELLEIFNDPMLEGVRIPTTPQTADDRIQRKLLELSAWVEINGREPEISSSNLKEKLLAKSMETLKDMGLWT